MIVMYRDNGVGIAVEDKHKPLPERVWETYRSRLVLVAGDPLNYPVSP